LTARVVNVTSFALKNLFPDQCRLLEPRSE
jgi:hypothetical protein